MTICPIAIAVGCRKCPAFAVCPLKTAFGDHAPEAAKTRKKSSRRKPAPPRS